MSTKEKIKTRTFEIPKALLGMFFTKLEENELDYELIDVNQEEEELEITISYATHQKDEVMDLIELIDDYYSENEEENDEQEDED